MRTVVPAGAYLAALSKRLNRACSNRTGSISTIGRSLASSTSTRCCARILLARSQGAADNLAEVMQSGVRHDSARFQLGHVEQIGDEAVEPLRFVDDRGEKIGFGMLVQGIRHAPKRSCRPEDCRERRPEVMRDRGQERRAQAIRFGGSFRPIQVFDQADALNGERRLVHQGIEQPPLVWGQQRARFVGIKANDPNGAAAGVHRQEETLGARKGIRTTTCGSIALPGPRRSGQIRLRRACPPAGSPP